jgi:hypothetical protein
VRRLLVIADSDSYVKWGAALASRMPTEWLPTLSILQTPVAPSERQLGAALAHTAFAPSEVLSLPHDRVADVVHELRPDAVLLSLRGPLVRVVAPVVAALPNRPVLVSGFPGLTIPAVPKAVVYRELVDLIVLHSRREVREFGANAEAAGVPMRFGLTTLPFLADAAGSASARRDAIVFAAQAKVPSSREDRVRVLAHLAAAARARPAERVVVKVRARAGEAQTHDEAFDYAALLADPDVQAEIGGVPANLEIADGPMAAQLRRASALVTVSSTAALEAAAADVPTLLIDDFGVSPELINPVFEGSGLFGPGQDIAAGRFHTADAAWRDDNYFHGAEADTWLDEIDALVRARDGAPLAVPVRIHNLTGGALRRAYERKRMLGVHDRSVTGAFAMIVAVPGRWLLRRARTLRRLVLGSRGADTRSDAAAAAPLVASAPAEHR